MKYIDKYTIYNRFDQNNVLKSPYESKLYSIFKKTVISLIISGGGRIELNKTCREFNTEQN